MQHIGSHAIGRVPPDRLLLLPLYGPGGLIDTACAGLQPDQFVRWLEHLGGGIHRPTHQPDVLRIVEESGLGTPYTALGQRGSLGLRREGGRAVCSVCKRKHGFKSRIMRRKAGVRGAIVHAIYRGPGSPQRRGGQARGSPRNQGDQAGDTSARLMRSLPFLPRPDEGSRIALPLRPGMRRGAGLPLADGSCHPFFGPCRERGFLSLCAAAQRFVKCVMLHGSFLPSVSISHRRRFRPRDRRMHAVGRGTPSACATSCAEKPS